MPNADWLQNIRELHDALRLSGVDTITLTVPGGGVIFMSTETPTPGAQVVHDNLQRILEALAADLDDVDEDGFLDLAHLEVVLEEVR